MNDPALSGARALRGRLPCTTLNGYASLDATVREGDMTPLFEAILKHVPACEDDQDGPPGFQGEFTIGIHWRES